MLGGVVNPEPLRQAASFLRLKGLVERARLVRVEALGVGTYRME